jgi:membrane protein
MKIKTLANKIACLLKESFNHFIEDNGLKLSAALSYYTIFSLPPLLIIIISLCGFVFGAEAVRGDIFGQINGLVGNTAAHQIEETLKNIKLSSSNIFTSSISIILLLIGASGVFSEIQESINYIWGIKTKPKRGLKRFIYSRLMTFSMIGFAGILLFVGLLFNSFLDIINKAVATNFSPNAFYLFYGINSLIVFIIIIVLFTIIFKTLPDGKVALKDCIIGASFTSLLFMIGKFAISTYLVNSSIASVYGAAASFIIILAWVYYSAIILYFGAEFTKVYAQTHGQKIVPYSFSLQIDK